MSTDPLAAVRRELVGAAKRRAPRRRLSPRHAIVLAVPILLAGGIAVAEAPTVLDSGTTSSGYGYEIRLDRQADKQLCLTITYHPGAGARPAPPQHACAPPPTARSPLSVLSAGPGRIAGIVDESVAAVEVSGVGDVPLRATSGVPGRFFSAAPPQTGGGVRMPDVTLLAPDGGVIVKLTPQQYLHLGTLQPTPGLRPPGAKHHGS